ncbi:MAG: hypothetical protein Q9213_001619 [Squamulea squamosa]
MAAEQVTSSLKDRHRAYVLLVELLAIDTQDVLFQQKNAKRVVEIGASNVLGTMASRTIAGHYEWHDPLDTVPRKILSWAEDAKEICYEAMEEKGRQPEKSEPNPQPPRKQPTIRTVKSKPPRQAKASPVPDEPVTAEQILRVIFAHKLKISLTDVALTASIKVLAGGKSTLQNELIGDIENEFGGLPDGPEDLPLAELAKKISVNNEAGLGKQASSLISKMMSTKMPGGFGTAEASKYLETQWGLGPERQKAVVLGAVVTQPTVRLATVDEAKAFFDTAAKDYASQTGVSLMTDRLEGEDEASSATAVIDPTALDRISDEHNRLSTRQLEILASHLNVDLRASEKILMNSQAAQDAKQDQIDLWNIEHGEFYARGLNPMFDPLMTRSYNSAWNWVRDDIFAFYQSLAHPQVDVELEMAKWRIKNKCNTKTLDFLRYLCAQSQCVAENDRTKVENAMFGLVNECQQHQKSKPLFKGAFRSLAPQTVISAEGVVEYSEVPRTPDASVLGYYREIIGKGEYSARKYSFEIPHAEHSSKRKPNPDVVGTMLEAQNDPGLPTPPEDSPVDDTESTTELSTSKQSPPLSLKQWRTNKWEYDWNSTRLYMHCLHEAAGPGISFSERVVLLTGSAEGSIGGKILEGLLSGGATVIATTSNFSRANTNYFRNVYTLHGARGSRLIILPFNQSSKQDVQNLVHHIYDPEKGLGLDLDHLLPFAAISEGDTQIDDVDSRSELAHRLMLTNVIRLLGQVKRQKWKRNCLSRPTQVILPLSPNHGTFGGDGLYSESKIALETLFHKWASEDWGDILTICGANIGWTRGTGLMSVNNVIAQQIEKLGVRTFSTVEMAFNILSLMSTSIKELCEEQPILADLTCGLDSMANLKAETTRIRKEIEEACRTRQLLAREQEHESGLPGKVPNLTKSSVRVEPRANLDFGFPSLPHHAAECVPSSLQRLHAVDLEKIVVVTGFAEVGPLGNARTRWDMEAHGNFSLEGCVEMAWIMGLIKHHTGPVKGMRDEYSGWIDTKTGEPLSDCDINSRFETRIVEHSGIRLIEPSMLQGRDNRLFQEVVIKEDLAPFEASKEEAFNFQKVHRTKAEITPKAGTDVFNVVIKAGAVVSVPREVPYDYMVGAQVPEGWDPRRYGVPQDIINQVNKTTLYTLVCTAEALLSSGVVDVYEFYEHVHASEMANCIGSGLGGADALRSIYKDRTLNKPVPNDIIQEALPNTIAAWVNMLLLSSSGPIKTPVGACATALESVSIGYETILLGQARICFVGGVDNFSEDIGAEFGNMRATVDPRAEAARGRSPKEMSRPNTSTRAGFVKSEGCGIQVLTTAKLALQMGLPIHGIIAMASTATDKIGRSVPAPGQGLLVTAREDSKTNMAPIRRALAQWGLKPDDLAVAYMHGTSTIANDKNESDLVCKQLRHLGRHEGNPILCVTQKSLTGHPLGAAGAWMLNGAMQVLDTGLVPGNQNLDNVDREFQEFDLIHYPARSIQKESVEAISVTSFGFGQKSAQTIVVHPRHLFAALDKTTYDEYKARTLKRQQQTYRQWHHRIISNSIFQAKEKPPYSPGSETSVLLSPNARASKNEVDGMFSISVKPTSSSPHSPPPSSTRTTLGPDDDNHQLRESHASLDRMVQSIPAQKFRTGIDIVSIDTINIDSPTFIARNFTTSEQDYCNLAATRGSDPRASFAARWAAKEAIFKSLGVAGKGAGAAMRDIEIVNDENGAPAAKLHGDAKARADAAGVKDIQVSISHTESQTVAVAVASV